MKTMLTAATLFACCILMAFARDSGRRMPASDCAFDVVASRLSAKAELARYATYYAAGANTRDLGSKMGLEITREAAAKRISLPAALTESDRQLVRRLESLNGDDFDVAFAAWAAGQP